MNLENSKQIKIAEALKAISHELVIGIPGWKALGDTHLTKKAPTYAKVYQTIANFMRTEKHFFEHVAAYGKPPEATPTPGADPGSEDDHESAEVTESEAESQHDDQDDAAVFVEPVRVDREI